MGLRDRLVVNKYDFPTMYEVMLGTRTFNFEFLYRESMGTFYVNLYDENEAPLVMGERLVYGQALFAMVNDERLPDEDIIPMDESGQEHEVNWDNFGNTVFLCIDDLDPALTDPDSALNNGSTDDLLDDDTDDPVLVEDESNDDMSLYGDADDTGMMDGDG
ncbi:hypothetical protein MUDAN_DOGOELCO_03217 [Lactiplantibacillus mudanjiangensis]|nr:hypothetical protein MUDAN_DOGOELCO_03217 [Lactiplantibacillus mudanjiangensis]